MNLRAKAALFSAVAFLTARAAFAQVTVDLDVLTEDFIPKDTISSDRNVKKNGAAALIDPAEKKAGPTKKKSAKQSRPPQKQNKSAKPPKAKGYQVREAAVKDEHDKLKPRAKPVPQVKILAVDWNRRNAPKSPKRKRKRRKRRLPPPSPNPPPKLRPPSGRPPSPPPSERSRKNRKKRTRRNKRWRIWRKR